MSDILKAYDAPVNPNIPSLRTGDMVSVHVKIKEGNRERIQEFKGVVLYQHNSGNDSTFTVRRVASNGIGVERTFLLRSPRIEAVALGAMQSPGEPVCEVQRRVAAIVLAAGESARMGGQPKP
ncbi:MAG: 50S ribosomal protein L19, partial [Chloroflexi bacterium]|nr:50S ribosomal protein L19 [Chloroflexota bacterium]